MPSYAGIGSRKTPLPITRTMTGIARTLAEAGWTLRSGHADRADQAFENGAIQAHGKREIFLPWRGFEGSQSPLYNPPREAFVIAARFHPCWDDLSGGEQKLMARNSQQVLGEHLNNPVAGVLCWTSEGRDVGGTSQALRIARAHHIPIVNLGDPAFRNASPDRLLTEFERLTQQAVTAHCATV